MESTSAEKAVPTTMRGARIVVGAMDAPESEAAVRWAAGHAARTGSELHLLHAMVWAEMGVSTDPVPGIAGSGMDAAARSLLEDLAALAREAGGDITITSEIVNGNATGALVAASREADLIVVGGRGLGRLATLVVGSKSLALAARSHCPVAIVRGEIDTKGPIGLVHDDSVTLVERAAELARAYDTGLEVILGSQTASEEADAILASTRETIERVAPGVEVGRAIVPVRAGARELVEACEGTCMIVAAGSADAAQKDSFTQKLSTVLRFANTPVWIER